MTSAAFSVIGGYVAITSGFPALIIVVVTLSLVGSILLYPIKPYLRFSRAR